MRLYAGIILGIIGTFTELGGNNRMKYGIMRE